MSEFKAQILGILIVIGVFAILAASAKTLVQNTWTNVSNELSEVMESN